MPYGSLFFLGGSLSLLAGGVKLLLRKVGLRQFVICYSALVGIVGVLRLQLVGFHFLIAGWLLMTFCVGGLLLSLHGPNIWAIAGQFGAFSC